MNSTQEVEHYTFEQKDTEDSLEISPWSNGLNFEIDSPWWGSTDTGFGATLSITIPKSEIPNLLKWLQKVAPRVV